LEELNGKENIDDILISCPYCKEQIKKEAVKCKHCGATLKSKLKDIVSKIKKILSSRILWFSISGLIVLALIIQFIVIPLFEQYKIRQNAIKQYKEYIVDKKNNKRNIYKIFQQYKDLDTPIDELNKKIKEVQTLIANKKFNKLIKIDKIGGYASKGRKISMTSGYGTILTNYVEATNLTDIPLKIYFVFDLENTSYTTTSYTNWLGGTGYNSQKDVYIYQKNNTDSTYLYSKETDTTNASFNKIRYYNGYRVTRQYNDGSYNYDYDDSKNLKAINLKIKSIEIYK